MMGKKYVMYFYLLHLQKKLFTYEWIRKKIKTYTLFFIRSNVCFCCYNFNNVNY